MCIFTLHILVNKIWRKKTKTTLQMLTTQKLTKWTRKNCNYNARKYINNIFTICDAKRWTGWLQNECAHLRRSSKTRVDEQCTCTRNMLAEVVDVAPMGRVLSVVSHSTSFNSGCSSDLEAPNIIVFTLSYFINTTACDTCSKLNAALALHCMCGTKTTAMCKPSLQCLGPLSLLLLLVLRAVRTARLTCAVRLRLWNYLPSEAGSFSNATTMWPTAISSPSTIGLLESLTTVLTTRIIMLCRQTRRGLLISLHTSTMLWPTRWIRHR